MKIALRISIILTAFMLSVAGATHAREKENFVTCNQNQKDNINAVWQYIRDNIRVLRKDYEWKGRLPRDRKRVNRRMKREISSTTVVCQGTNEPRCNDRDG